VTLAEIRCARTTTGDIASSSFSGYHGGAADCRPSPAVTAMNFIELEGSELG
jgi:hypothetical protein